MHKTLAFLCAAAALAASASPVRSDLGGEALDVEAAWILTAEDYIQDGLIRQLDSIETLGYGIEEHETGTYLYNLATGVRSGVRIGTNASWDGEWITMTSSLSNDVFSDNTTAIANAYQNGSWTLEFCGILSSAVGCYDNSSNNYGWRLGGIAYHSNISSFGVYGGGVMKYIPYEFYGPAHFSLVRDGTTCYFYVNGILWTSFSATVDGVAPNLRRFYIYAGTVMGSYRFYNTALSAIEIFFNHMVDYRRFGL